jgi:hypothetical protein
MFVIVLKSNNLSIYLIHRYVAIYFDISIFKAICIIKNVIFVSIFYPFLLLYLIATLLFSFIGICLSFDYTLSF